MAKRRRPATPHSRINPGAERPGFSRRTVPPPSSRGRPTSWYLLGGLAVVAVLAVLAYFLFLAPGAAGPSPSPTIDASGLRPPAATPLANPPAEPAGDGTRATIETEQGNIVIELYTESAPVAAENFINLAEADYYRGVGFHRIIPRFMIQGGDPEGTGSGGPGYTIPDEPVVGEYTRGTVAMARSELPNSQGSQFFIVVEDAPHLTGGGYVIFGRVLEGMEVADAIVSQPRTGRDNDLAVDPVLMTEVTIQHP